MLKVVKILLNIVAGIGGVARGSGGSAEVLVQAEDLGRVSVPCS